MTSEEKKRLLDEWFDGNPPPPGFTFEFPNSFPPIANFVCDYGGNMFIQTYEKAEDGNGYYCDLFDSQGRYIAKIPLKARNCILLRYNY